MAWLVSPVNHPLTRLVKEVLAGGATAVAAGGGGGGGGGGAADAMLPAVAAGAGGGIDVTLRAVAAGAGAGAGIDVTLPAVAAGAGAGVGGGDPEPVNPVSDEQPAKAVSAIMPEMIVRKLRHSVPSLASRR